jgi:hypothetical protein
MGSLAGRDGVGHACFKFVTIENAKCDASPVLDVLFIIFGGFFSTHGQVSGGRP